MEKKSSKAKNHIPLLIRIPRKEKNCLTSHLLNQKMINATQAIEIKQSPQLENFFVVAILKWISSKFEIKQF